MDILKSCMTNIRRIDDLSLLRLSRYGISSATLEDTTAVELRRRDVLWHIEGRQLYVFYQAGASALAEKELQDFKLSLEEDESIKDVLKQEGNTGIVDKLEAALDASLSSRLLNEHGLHRFGLLCWIHCSDDPYSSDATMLRLHLRTQQPHTLYLATTAHTVQAYRIADLSIQSVPSTVHLSPNGLQAYVAEVSSRSKISSQQPSDRDTAHDHGWKSSVIKALASYAVEILPTCEWISLRLAGTEDIFLWPKHLCYAFGTRRNNPSSPVWSTPGTGDDPLSFAESWLLSADDRARELDLKHRQQQQRESPTDGMETVSQARLDADTATSPPYLYRPDAINTLSVYPTPPDGMTTSAAQMTVPAESAVPSIAANDPNNLGSTLFRTSTHDDEGLLELRARGPSIASSVGQPYRQSMDDLFGEGDAELGNAEVDDDDFDFFDDGDDLVTQQDRPHSSKHDLPPHSAQDEETIAQTPDQLLEHAGSHKMDVDDSVPPLLNQGSDSSMHPALADTTPSPPLENQSTSLEPKFEHPPQISKPLSPFDIRERLLPPPIPASIANQSGLDSVSRKRSSFDPLTLNSNQGFLSRMRSEGTPFGSPASRVASRRASLAAASLSPYTSGQNIYHNSQTQDDELSDASSDEDVSQTIPPSLPWQSHKRKRPHDRDSTTHMSWEVQPYSSSPGQDSGDMIKLLQRLTAATASLTSSTLIKQSRRHSHGRYRRVFAVEAALRLRSEDLVEVAQLLADHAVSCLHSIVIERDLESSSTAASTQSGDILNATLTDMLSSVLPMSKECDVNMLAMVKEHIRPALSHVKGQPRPQIRSEATQGPDIQALPAPYLRFCRADTTLEMLPPTIGFWEELSLSPCSGSKNIAVFCVAPSSVVKSGALATFWESFAATYEGCKLGSVDAGELSGQDTTDEHTRNLRVVDIPDTDNLDELASAYSQINVHFAKSLAEHPATSQQVTALICFVNPVSDGSFTPLICGSFHMLRKKYQDMLPGDSVLQTEDKLCLHVLPITIFAEENTMQVLRPQNMAVLAREVYDRCPGSHSNRSTSPLSIAKAPAISLAEQIPKRINLQLTVIPPSDLLHDNSELHVAYAKSADGLWLTVCWLDSTGSGQHTSSFCLRDISFSAVAEEVMERTVDILRARDVSWRVTLATNMLITREDAKCWQEAISSKSLGRGSLTVTLVAIELDPVLTLVGAAASSEPPNTQSNSGGGFLTPVTTPQGTSFSFSPDTNGQGTPSTPAPTDTVTETDADAQLVDLADESWRVLVGPDVPLAIHHPDGDRANSIAQGVLIKHGDTSNGPQHRLPLSAVRLVFMMRVRADGNGVEVATARQAEMMLREILSAYRNLTLLAKARRLSRNGEECLPLHLLCVIRGAEALNGFL